MIEFDETGLYKGFVKNAKGQKYQSGRNPKIMSLQEANQYEGFSGVMNANTVLLDADEQPYSDILQNIIKGEKLGAYVTDRQGRLNVEMKQKLKYIKNIDICDEIVIDDVDVLMMINVVHDYLKDNYRIFDDCK